MSFEKKYDIPNDKTLAEETGKSTTERPKDDSGYFWEEIKEPPWQQIVVTWVQETERDKKRQQKDN